MTVLLLTASILGVASSSQFEDLLRENRAAISIVDGQLVGPGAQVLASAVEGAQFIFIGEDHGVSEVARFCEAIHRRFQPQGFDTLALEIGPYVAEKLSSFLKQENPLRSHQAFLRDHSMTVAFYNTREEFEFIQQAARLSGPRFEIIGFDQELMGSGKLLLEEVRRQPLTPSVKAMAKRLAIAEGAAQLEAVRTGRPDLLFMMTAPRGELLELQEALVASKRNSDPIINLLASRDVYEEYFKKNGYQSNVARSLLMRKYFMNRFARNPNRKVILKAGANHAYKGVNPVYNRDLGNFIAEMAEGRQQKSVHLLIVAAAGKQLTFVGAGKPMQAMPITVNKDSQIPGLKPVMQVAVSQAPDSWSLFDLRSLRARASEFPHELERVVSGFEFVVVIPQATPSTELSPGTR